MPEKLHRCVEKIKANGSGVDNPWAVCNKSINEQIDDIIQEHHNPLDIPFGREVPTKEFAISGDLSAQDVGGKKAFEEMHSHLMNIDKSMEEAIREWSTKP